MNNKPAAKPPLLVPPDVVLAIYGTWLSVLLSTWFAVHEFAASTSILDPFGINSSNDFEVQTLSGFHANILPD